MDAIYTDVVVICEAMETEPFRLAVARLKSLGLAVSLDDDDQSVVEGTIENHLIAALEADPAVKYVRRVASYEANFPPGDPRDRDGR